MVNAFAVKNEEATLNVIRDLCHIPAPSYGERRRAEYCKAWLESVGARGVYIDEVNNCLFPMNCEGSQEITVLAAHIDTVFPDTESYPEFREDEECIYCPGVNDNTCRVAAVMMTAKYFLENNVKPRGGILFALNSCEEGLGNLVGTKEIFRAYEGRIKQFITLDGGVGGAVNVAVGSRRYEVVAKTAGGHSYGAFGNKNAIAALSEIVGEIYALKVPVREGAKTTYNVGTIEGGTSVNTIAQSAKMLCEYRSNDRECLAVMQEHFDRIFGKEREGVTLSVTLVGERLCKGEVDLAVEANMLKTYERIVREVTGLEVKYHPSSTDANVPMSLGIPGVCLGVSIGRGSHTREEYIEKRGTVPSVEVSVKLMLALTA
ncbi:MAG: M20/M25/M40 family metallo-hydrolase [Clostridia bacterium]|nr:M20/M25/M40 family metallo-hydrolase [Clostridia bacterium]